MRSYVHVPEEIPWGGLLTRREAASKLGVSTRTLDRYIRAGKLEPVKNRVNGKVFIPEDQVLYLLGSRVPQSRLVVAYCRTAPIPGIGSSGPSAETRLREQVDRVMGYCAARGIKVDEVISEVRRAGRTTDKFDTLMELVVRKKVSALILETPDRIARWGAWEMIKRVLTWHGVEIHVIQPKHERGEFIDEIKEELVDIIAAARELGV